MAKQIEKEAYKRIKLLGDGSFGKAFLCEDVRDGSLGVVKEIEMKGMSESEKLETLKEAKILQALNHPNIIKFKEVYYTKSGVLKIVMDYAQGGDLAKKIKEIKGFIPEKQVLDWFTQLCLGMKHIHDRKIIHRDIKTQNIFLTNEDIVKIGDFGIAKVMSFTRDKARTIIGTPYYLSPEIVENKPYNFKSDVWSVGVVLYEMLCKKPPFDGNSIQFLALKIVKGSYSPIPNIYSRDISNVVSLLLKTDPTKRPSVNDILKNKIVTNRVKEFLSESVMKQEFAHTILHNKKLVDSNFNLNNIPMVDEKLLMDKPRLFLKKEESKKESIQVAKRIQTPKSEPPKVNIAAKRVITKPVEKPQNSVPMNFEAKSNGSKQRIVSNVNCNAKDKKQVIPASIKRPSIPNKALKPPNSCKKEKPVEVNKVEESEKRKRKLEEERNKMREDIQKRKKEGKPSSNFKIEWYPGWGQGENENPSIYKQSPRNLSRNNSKSKLSLNEETKLSRNSSKSRLIEETPHKNNSRKKSANEKRYSSEKKQPPILSMKNDNSKDLNQNSRIKNSEDRSNSAKKSKNSLDLSNEKIKEKPSLEKFKKPLKENPPQSKWLLKNNKEEVLIKKSNESLPPMPYSKRGDSNKSGMKNLSSVEVSLQKNSSQENEIKSNNSFADKKDQIEKAAVKNSELSKMFFELQNMVNDACMKADNIALNTQHNSDDSKIIPEPDDLLEREELDISMDDLLSDPMYNKVEEMKKDFFKSDEEALMYISGDSKLEVGISM